MYIVAHDNMTLKEMVCILLYNVNLCVCVVPAGVENWETEGESKPGAVSRNFSSTLRQRMSSLSQKFRSPAGANISPGLQRKSNFFVDSPVESKLVDTCAYVWQPQGEIKHYFVAYFDLVSAFEALPCKTHKCCIDA